MLNWNTGQTGSPAGNMAAKAHRAGMLPLSAVHWAAHAAERIGRESTPFSMRTALFLHTAEKDRPPRRIKAAILRMRMRSPHTAKRSPAAEPPPHRPHKGRRSSPPKTARTKSRAKTSSGRPPSNPARAKSAHPARAFRQSPPARRGRGRWSKWAGRIGERAD